MKKIEQQKSDHSNLRRYQLSAQIFILINRDVTFMRMTYSHFFEIRLKSIKFDENLINILIVTIFYSHIIRIFQDFVLFAYYSHIYQLLFAFLCTDLNLFTRIKVTSLLIKQYHYYTHILYSRVVQTVGPGPKFGPLTDFFWAL